MTISSLPLLSSTSLILADSHVHIYSCFNLSSFLESALINFQNSSAVSKSQQDYTGVLFLTESCHENYFSELVKASESQQNSNFLSGWKIFKTNENCSLYARSSDEKGVYLLAGRQIITAEKLEILALATIENIPEGLPLELTIQEVIDRGGIPVIPWGFGKWFGRRGRLLGNLLKQKEYSMLFLGDNSGRPKFWSRPPLFQKAEQKGIKILPGTDPLPFASEFNRPGKFGFSIIGNLNPTQPAESMKQLLKDTSTSIQPYGPLETPGRFVKNQIAMQFVKHNRIEK
jgi:hypothetical protein